MYYYLISIAAVLVCALLGAWASSKVNRAYKKCGKIGTKSRMTGYDTAKRLMQTNGVIDVEVGRVEGTLSDHYHPSKGIVNLSQGVYGDTSVAAVAVAAHEVGHVMQDKKGYFFYRVRTVLVPITNFGSRLAMPLVLIGLLLDFFVGLAQDSNLGFSLAMLGVILYGLSTVFALVTLPVELNASRRAKKMLLAEGIIAKDEVRYADEMLSAAAMTYVASLLTSLIYFLRFFLWVILMFGGRRNRD